MQVAKAMKLVHWTFLIAMKMLAGFRSKNIERTQHVHQLQPILLSSACASNVLF